MKIIFQVLLKLFLISITIISQQYDYWKNASIGENKIYFICFTNEQNGYACSFSDELFVTSDSGNTWNFKSKNSDLEKPECKDILWSAEIYCSVMQTTDGGENWSPYSKERQEHFCGVYLKDINSEYKIANEFLNKVTTKIFISSRNNELTNLKQPQQCTEYYTNENEGWALGWCIKNFKSIKE